MFFSFFFFSLFISGHAMNLGQFIATTDHGSAFSRKREKQGAFGGSFELGQPSRGVVT